MPEPKRFTLMLSPRNAPLYACPVELSRALAEVLGQKPLRHPKDAHGRQQLVEFIEIAPGHLRRLTP